MAYLVNRIDIQAVARELLFKYHSRSEALLHKPELVKQYGEERFWVIMMEMGILEENLGEELGKLIDEDKRRVETKKQLEQAKVEEQKNEQETKRSEREAKQRKANELYFFLKRMFIKEAEYPFVVTGRFVHNYRLVVDDYGNPHPINLPSAYREGETVICKVMDWVYDRDNSTVYLRLSQPHRSSVVPEGEPSRFLISPEQWHSEVDGLGKHKCGKPFTCNCCGRYYPANKGVRVDGKEIYFCDYCKKHVYMKSGRGWKGAIISTPMGNKR